MVKKVMLLQYDFTKTTGAQIMGIKLANELSEYFDVSIASLYSIYSSKPAYPVRSKIKTHTLLEEKKNLFLNARKIANLITEIINEYNIDCIISISSSMNLVLSLVKKNTEVKVIYAEHANLANTYSDGKLTPLYRYIGVKKMNFTVVLTEREKKSFTKKFNVNENRIKVIPNWIELPNKTSTYIKNENENKIKKIISVGRLEYVKGFDMLLQVAEILVRNENRFIWDIYGEGSQHDSLLKDITKLGLENYVFLKGHNSKIYNVYNQYDMLVMTSRSEGLPLVLLEGLSHGLPLVAFDINSGPSEIIKDGNTGFLVNPFDINKMADKIEFLIKNNYESLEMEIEDTALKFDKNNVLNLWKSLITR